MQKSFYQHSTTRLLAAVPMGGKELKSLLPVQYVEPILPKTLAAPTVLLVQLVPDLVGRGS